MNIEYSETQIGLLKITANDHSVCKIELNANRSEPENGNEITAECIKQLNEYFSGERIEFDIPVEPEGTDFQLKVWRALCSIPYGETRSYSGIAEAIGKPEAQRAVGMANNKNPIPIIIPCHRVIGKNGSLTGYAGGIEMKKKLLEAEKHFTTQKGTNG